MGILKEREVLSLGDGMHCDGDYLWLRVKGDARSWIVRGPRINGKKPEAGLGSVERVSLALARKERDKLIEQWRNGKDPVADRRAAREALANRKTFADVAQAYLSKDQDSWRVSECDGRASTLDAYRRNFERDCAPIARKGVEEITVDDIERVLQPYWDRETWKAARDFLSRLERVFGFAIAKKWRPNGTNPASWEIFDHLWPKAGKDVPVKHRAALPWSDIPDFMQQLRASNAVAARVVEFAILTATRSGETRGAKWSEIDWEAKTWTVPTTRMKTGKKTPEPHVVPLSDQAIALLERVKAGVEGALIFPGYVDDGSRRQRAAEPIPNASVWKLVKHIDYDVTTHGFRSTFRDWCGDHGIDRELAERSLAHKFGSAVESAYARSTLVARRAVVMQQWADFCDGAPTANVMPFKRSA